MTGRDSFDPYALLTALNGGRVSFVAVGAFARVVHGSAEVTRGLDIVPSLRDENLRRLQVVVEELDGRGPSRRRIVVEGLEVGGILRARTGAGELQIVASPWGTRGYDDLRIRANRENLGRGARPAVASLPDLARMLEASRRVEDVARLERLRRLMELENELVRSRRLTRGRGLELGR
jgi:hypothetical protein